MEISPDQKATAMATADSDLKFLFDKEGVSEDIQAVFYHIGITNLRTFASLVRDAAELREIMKSDFKLDAAESLQTRVKVSKGLVAWETAQKRAAKVVELEAEAEARSEPKKVSLPDFKAMEQSFVKSYWKMEEKSVPAKSYIEVKLDQVEKDYYKAELLTEVICTDEDDQEILKPIWDVTGNFKAVKVSSRTSFPKNTEDLRYRLSLMGSAWVFVRFAHPGRTVLKEVTPQLFVEYANYLLGEDVLGHLNEQTGGPVDTKAWELLLKYEQSIRKKTMRDMTSGTPIHTALRRAWEDPVVKERKFTTPLAKDPGSLHEAESNSGIKRKWGNPNYTPQYSQNHTLTSKGKGKGKDKGKPKGWSSKEPVCKDKTDEGKPICFNYNNKLKRCTNGKKCRFLHVCGICEAPGVPMHACRHGR